MAKKLFLNRILSIVKHFTQLKLIFCVLLLVFLNYFHSTYFQCSTIVHQLSLVYYQSINNWLDLITICVFVLIYYIFGKIIYEIEMKKADTSSNKILVDNVQQVEPLEKRKQKVLLYFHFCYICHCLF